MSLRSRVLIGMALIAVVLIGVAVIAALRRQWLVLALSLGFFVSLVPYAAFSLGRGERYFYIPGALLALLLGAAATVCVASLAKLKTSAPIDHVSAGGSEHHRHHRPV
mgnify:CR=1 FL=1